MTGSELEWAGQKDADGKFEMRNKLERWLNKNMRIKMTDGRILMGIFVCTDKDKNVILGSCQEYLKTPDSGEKEEPRVLGLAMVPGYHIVSIEVDDDENSDRSSVQQFVHV